LNVCYLTDSSHALDTYALDTRPLYVLPALTLHGAVPGHHLQGAGVRNDAGADLPSQLLSPHAFDEGWGLYSENPAASRPRSFSDTLR
jgi:uncharacterized protein (DUF885 family)